jgi:hypothetical protein
MALVAGSPARDIGATVGGLPNDQRGAGYARVAGSGADAGAFELQASANRAHCHRDDGHADRHRNAHANTDSDGDGQRNSRPVPPSDTPTATATFAPSLPAPHQPQHGRSRGRQRPPELPSPTATPFDVGCDASALQAAVSTAGSNDQADTITLAAGCTYTLTSRLELGGSSSGSLTINGNGATISGGNSTFGVLDYLRRGHAERTDDHRWK